MRELRDGAHIIVATPGRLIDLIERRSADISGVRFVVLDEADEMLNMGFRDEIRLDSAEYSKGQAYLVVLRNDAERSSEYR